MSTSTLTENPCASVQMDEVWRAHPEFTWLRVSTHGRVWSERSQRLVGHISGNSRTHGSAAPGTAAERPGALAVTVSRSGRKRYVHVLVLETFVGPRPADHDGDHIDHDKFNNRLTNLRWRPVSENRADR